MKEESTAPAPILELEEGTAIWTVPDAFERLVVLGHIHPAAPILHFVEYCAYARGTIEYLLPTESPYEHYQVRFEHGSYDIPRNLLLTESELFRARDPYEGKYLPPLGQLFLLQQKNGRPSSFPLQEELYILGSSSHYRGTSLSFFFHRFTQPPGSESAAIYIDLEDLRQARSEGAIKGDFSTFADALAQPAPWE